MRSLFVVLVLLLGVPREARAEDLGARLSMGTGVALRGLGSQALPAFPVEVTLSILPVVSFSAGLVATENGIDHAYGEFGLYFIASLGAGLGYGAFGDSGKRVSDVAYHLFVGLPIPLVSSRKLDETIGTQRFVYLLPYYRPSWGPWPGAIHEVGVMFKFGFPLKPLEYHR